MKLLYVVYPNTFGKQEGMIADTTYLELKRKLNPSIFTENDRPQCLQGNIRGAGDSVATSPSSEEEVTQEMSSKLLPIFLLSMT